MLANLVEDVEGDAMEDYSKDLTQAEDLPVCCIGEKRDFVKL